MQQEAHWRGVSGRLSECRNRLHRDLVVQRAKGLAGGRRKPRQDPKSEEIAGGRVPCNRMGFRYF